MPMSDQEALKVIETKRQSLIARLRAIDEQIGNLQAEKSAIAQGLADCDAAARVFTSGSGNVVVTVPTATLTIRELVLAALEASHPDPMRARDLHERMESIKKGGLHWKTIGMTLFRLKKDGLVRRDGHWWFFVPQEAEKKNPGGETPGLL